MDVSTLEIFIEVMRKGSFAAVARDRNVDPSSVSRTIAALESELGTRLFQRTTRRLSPTEAGSIYFDRIEPVLGEIENARALATDLSREPQGTLRVTAPVSFAQANLIPLIPEFSAKYPDVAFDLVLTDDPVDLLSERVDLAFRIGPLDESSYVATKLAPLVGIVCASPAYLERHGTPASPYELRDHNCMLLDLAGFSHRWKFRRTGEDEIEIPVRGNCRTSNAIALRDFAVAGMGVILQAEWIVGQAIQEGRLVQLFGEHQSTASRFDNAIWLMYPSRDYMPLKVRAFVDFVKTHFKSLRS
ncbi:MAG: LysR family transcriptional regulator [Alphaproteobacteria bacterium]|nr:LysR family transcriptional regulator [Alphaproteobacteria bacterium]